MSLKFNPDIIEVDVRKSRDGVLYCHHGSVPLGVCAATFFGFLTFKQIQSLIGQRDPLAAVLSIIPSDTLVYLDIKDGWVHCDDLRPFIVGRRNIWIAPFGTIKQLRHLRRGLGEDFAYAFNRPALFPKRVANHLTGLADMMQFFYWSWNADTVRRDPWRLSQRAR